MATNPPKGYPRLSPYLNYKDTGAMIEWLAKAFGFQERERMSSPDGMVFHAEMTFHDSVIMMGTPAGPDFKNPNMLGQTTQSLYIYVDDVDEHSTTARAAGAEIIEEPTTQDYGDRRYGAKDPEGHVWYFAARTKD